MRSIPHSCQSHQSKLGLGLIWHPGNLSKASARPRNIRTQPSPQHDLGLCGEKLTGICRDGRAWAWSVKNNGNTVMGPVLLSPRVECGFPRCNATLTWVKVWAEAGHLSSSRHGDVGHRQNKTLSGILAWAKSRLTSSLSSLLQSRMQSQNGCSMLQENRTGQALGDDIRTVVLRRHFP